MTDTKKLPPHLRVINTEDFLPKFTEKPSVPMRPYDNLSVTLAYQNCGSVWLMVLRGPEAEIELAYNGLYNFGATGGKYLDFTDHTKTTAKFWSNEERMYNFFHSRFMLKHNKQKAARIWADEKMRLLRDAHEKFYTFVRRAPDVSFGVSTASAERPDTDMKDAILTHAFSEKELTNA